MTKPPRFEEVHPESDMQMLLRRVIKLEQQVEQMQDVLRVMNPTYAVTNPKENWWIRT